MNEPAAPLVRVDVLRHVATITLDDPSRRNAMTPELGDALRDAVARVASDPNVRAVVLTGAGSAFCGGGDLKMLERLRTVGRDASRDFMLEFYARYLAILDLPVPVIASVHGAAIGAGLCIALACDLLVVDEDAKLALNFVQLGLHPGMGATYLTPLRVGAERARELLFTGRRFDGREAASMGLALRAVPTGSALTEATAIATQIAAGAPLAVRALKSELAVDRAALDRALGLEASYQADSYASDDLGEGLRAAGERRVPMFQGT